PIIYGLDGNSIAGMAFWRQDGRLEPVVQVFIGYPTEEPVEPRRRFLDLTFSERNPDKPGPPPPPGAKGGGGDTFARVIEEESKPCVRSGLKPAPGPRAFGGLRLGELGLMRFLFRNRKGFLFYCFPGRSSGGTITRFFRMRARLADAPAPGSSTFAFLCCRP